MIAALDLKRVGLLQQSGPASKLLFGCMPFRRTDPMRVLVVDDHEFIRKGIRSVLANEPSLTLCGEAIDGRDAVEKAKALRPDIVVMDISMPNMNGLEATREIKRVLPETEIVILSQHETREMVRQAFKMGAREYVVKSAISSDLLAAIKKVHQLGTFLQGDGLLGTNENIDAQEILQRSAALEQALGESEERFHSAMNGMAEGLYTIDIQGRVTYVNPSAEAMFGWTHGELVGKKMHDVTHYKRPDGSPFPAADCAGLLVLQKETELREHEDVFIRKDGSFFPVVFSASPLKVNGAVLGVVVCFRDDTKRREAEIALQLRSAIVDSSDDAIISKNLDGIITSWNRGAELIFGYSTEEAIGQHITLIIPPDHRAEEATILERLKRGERVDHFETVRVRKDGTRLDLALTISPVKDCSGRVVGASKVGRNITERKQIERALRESEERFRAIVETTPECVKLVTLEGTVLHMNSSGLTMVGANCAEMVVGKNVYDFIAPHDRDRFRAFNEKICGGERGSFEFDIVGLKGVGRHMETHAAPLRMPDGSLVQLAVSRDITDRKQRDAELARQAGLLDLSFNAVIVRDAEDRITYWNKGAEELYGWTRDEAMGQVTHTLFQTIFPEPLDSILVHLRREGRWQGELAHIRKNGTGLQVLSRWALTRDQQTNSESILEANIDVTQTKEAEHALHVLVETLENRVSERTRELENATDKLRDLSGRLLQTQDEERRRIARELHDGVGQLLAALKMNSSSVTKERTKLSAAARQSLDENATLIEQASQEIRTMSHLLHPPLLDEVGLESALRWYTDGFAQRSKISVHLQLAPDFSEGLPRDLALALFRIVQECLTNVHRHSESSSTFVTLARSWNEITLEVKDKGKGISPEIQSKISSGQSSGVGFRGMRERIHQFGGRLQVRCDEDGTRIVAILPAPDLPASAEDTPTGIQDRAEALSSRRYAEKS
jgi:PAS domain S-box-containing protein